MKWIEDNSGFFPGETALIVVCRKCGCRVHTFGPVAGVTYRLKKKKCSNCGHVLDWHDR